MSQIPYETGYKLACVLQYIEPKSDALNRAKRLLPAAASVAETQQAVGLLLHVLLHSQYPLELEEVQQVADVLQKAIPQGTSAFLFAREGVGHNYIGLLVNSQLEIVVIDPDAEQPFAVKNFAELLDTYCIFLLGAVQDATGTHGIPSALKLYAEDRIKPIINGCQTPRAAHSKEANGSAV